MRIRPRGESFVGAETLPREVLVGPLTLGPEERGSRRALGAAGLVDDGALLLQRYPRPLSPSRWPRERLCPAQARQAPVPDARRYLRPSGR